MKLKMESIVADNQLQVVSHDSKHRVSSKIQMHMHIERWERAYGSNDGAILKNSKMFEQNA